MNNFNFKLDASQWLSIAKGAGLAAIGAALTYVSQAASGVDFGVYGPLVAAGLAVLSNYIRKAATTPASPPTQQS